MKMKTSSSSSQQLPISALFFFCIIPLFLTIKTTLAQSAGAGFNYNPSSVLGPANWGSLRPEWFLCGNGTRQSPINFGLEATPVVNSESLVTTLRPANATLRNTGLDVELSWVGDAGFIELNGSQYRLVEVHWHTPSEHTIFRVRFTLEAHLVFRTSTNLTAVVGVLYVLGPPDHFLTSIEPNLNAIENTRMVDVSVGVRNPQAVVNLENREIFYRYTGSLTTPPCSEPVIWTVLQRLRTVSQRQVDIFRRALDEPSIGNARPIQPNNNRPISLRRPN